MTNCVFHLLFSVGQWPLGTAHKLFNSVLYQHATSFRSLLQHLILTE